MRRATVGENMPEHIATEPEHIADFEELPPIDDGDSDAYNEEFGDEYAGPFRLDEEKQTEDDMLFPPEHVEPLKGLLYLGFLSDEIEYAGHMFHIRTLTEGEILRIGQLMKAYRGTVTEVEARKMYTVAACILDVDGEQVYRAYEEGHDQIYEKAKVVKHWYPATVNAVYNAYIELESTAIAVSDSLKK